MPKASKPAAPETAPYLKQVRVRNYRSIQDTKVDFKPGLNIIIGKNGAGKTNFLNIANGLIELHGKHIDGLGCEIVIGGQYEIKALFKENESRIDQEPYRDLDNISKSLLVRATYNRVTIESEILDEAIDDLINDPLLPIYYTISYSPLLLRHGVPYKMPIVDESADITFGKGNIRIEGELKRLAEVGSTFVQSLARSINRMLRNGFTIKRGQTVAPISVKEAKIYISRIVDAYLIHFNKYLQTYSPISTVKRSDSFQIYHNTVQDEFIVKGLALEYTTAENISPLPFSALSDGTKRLFYLITELLSPNIISIDKTTEEVRVYGSNKIIFLEEPELGIHPDQLQKLLGFIREISKKDQVIMTTHSPQTLDMLSKNELDRITICELDPKKGTQFRKLSAAKKAKAKAYMQNDSYLSDFWRFSNLEDPD